MLFPDDGVLIARGKYSTLSKERHEQIKRVQDICRTMQGTVALIISEAQEKPPTAKPNLDLMGKCLENLNSAHERLITLHLGMAEIEPDAWPK